MVRIYARIRDDFAHYSRGKVPATVPGQCDVYAGIVDKDDVAAFLMVMPPSKTLQQGVGIREIDAGYSWGH